MTDAPAAAPASPPRNPVDHAPAVRAIKLTKRFGYREALRGVDLEIPADSCFLVLGPNGAGKSTFLKVVATRLRPTAGRLEVLGMDPRRRGAEVRAALGVVFHDTFLRGDLTLDENLRFYADLYRLAPAAAKERILALTERLGLLPRRHDAVRTFSQGMAKRAAIIRSLLHEPRVWVLDEPFAGLDPAGFALLEGMIAEEKSRRTVVLVTHDVDAGLRLADDGAAIVDGRVRARGKREVEAYAASLSVGEVAEARGTGDARAGEGRR